MGRLDGKRALITGARKGIGRGIVLALAGEGASVGINDLVDDEVTQHTRNLIESHGGRGSVHRGDMSTVNGIHTVIDAFVESHGGIDILVNNAGTSASGKFEDIAIDTWKSDIQLKVYGAIYCCLAALPHLKKSSAGRIINLTTWGGKATPGGTMPTSLSRAAGISLTKAMSKDYAADGILVNTVCVGVIKSGQTQRILDRKSTRLNSSH